MESKAIDLHEAEKRFGEVLALVIDGTEVVLADGTRPVARLVPIASPTTPRKEGLHPGAMWAGDDFDSPVVDELFGEGR